MYRHPGFDSWVRKIVFTLVHKKHHCLFFVQFCLLLLSSPHSLISLRPNCSRFVVCWFIVLEPNKQSKVCEGYSSSYQHFLIKFSGQCADLINRCCVCKPVYRRSLETKSIKISKNPKYLIHKVLKYRSRWNNEVNRSHQ